MSNGGCIGKIGIKMMAGTSAIQQRIISVVALDHHEVGPSQTMAHAPALMFVGSAGVPKDGFEKVAVGGGGGSGLWSLPVW
ncbi:uncharacterized protein PGTG_20768 [Puccinia graminis f. sp. tritici CRL 75-36-700-3]|uniref:Uncharacterized protein n=1 Tax=Puccinia graminis f. sp. tritici (strain CRL 75-36-700-3 / race SCCL) TaxID=418459 RepID=H6QP55_PUCGT|nr:uncharacterized protein PGTG_20768 [Puccinia graminis f. sp. tritici CRL 75-36-700-3]EHS63185.1 hypothetical protein PGTG_20768 [Puccinia graminis f. sp. tritici CRL 75-36-700-3]